MANSARIRSATTEYDAGLITTIEFLRRCSYSMAGYERRQRNWAINVEGLLNDNPPVQDIPHLEADMVIPDPVVQYIVNNNEGETEEVCKACQIVSMSMASEQYVMIPCGHGWICENCKYILNDDGAACIICRSHVQTFLRIYL